MASLESQVVRLNVITENLTARLEDANRVNEALLNELRGHDGEPGLVGRVIIVEREIGSLSKQFSDLSEKVDRIAIQPHISQYDSDVVVIPAKPQEAPAKVDGDTVVTWAWIRDKIILPVFIAALTFLMLNFIPQLFVHLGTAGK